MEEVVAAAKHNYGKDVQVEVGPDSSLAYDHIYHGIAQLTSFEQISNMYDKSVNYDVETEKLRKRVLGKLEEILDQVIAENEQRLLGKT